MIFPATEAGAVVIREADGDPVAQPDVQNAYVPPPSYVVTCDMTAIPSTCEARIEPRQINAIVSELVALAECFDPDGPWDCSKLNNLCAAFTTWSATYSSTLDATYVNVSGDTMEGPLILDAAPVDPMEAVNKQYVDDAVAAVAVDPTSFVLKAGDTMTGDLAIHKAAPRFVLDRVAGGSDAQLIGSVNGVLRWTWAMGDSSAESTANAGSNASLNCFSDAGAYLFSPLYFNRATGLGLLVGDPVVPLGIATKQYVDTVAGGVSPTGFVHYDIVQALPAAEREQARENIYAAPFDAMAYHGLQTNGSMEVNQEFYATAVTLTSRYVCDGWLMSKGGTMAFTANTPISVVSFPGYMNYLAINITTAQVSMGVSDLLCVHQVIEGYRSMRLAWGIGVGTGMPLTIGFWSAHHRTGLYSGACRNQAGTRSYAFTYTQAVADILQWNVVTIPPCPDGVWEIGNQPGIWVTFNVANGSGSMIAPNVWTAGNFIAATGQVNAAGATSDIFRLTGVIILPGSDAPLASRAPYIMRPFHEEYRLCERYYQKSFDAGIPVGTAKGNTYGSLECFSPNASLGATTRCFFHTVMRTSPTIVTYNPINADANWFDQNGAVSRLAAIAENMSHGFRATINASTTGNSPHYLNWSADARFF